MPRIKHYCQGYRAKITGQYEIGTRSRRLDGRWGRSERPREGYRAKITGQYEIGTRSRRLDGRWGRSERPAIVQVRFVPAYSSRLAYGQTGDPPRSLPDFERRMQSQVSPRLCYGVRVIIGFQLIRSASCAVKIDVVCETFRGHGYAARATSDGSSSIKMMTGCFGTSHI